MRFQSVFTVCLLILLIASTTAFDFGKVLKDTTQKVKESAQKVAQESKKAVEKTEDLAEKIKDKVGEKMKEAAIETATKFKEAHDTILSKAKEKLPKEELEAEKDKIVNKVAEELSKKIETEYKDKLDNEVIAEIFKIIQKRKNESGNSTSENKSIPVALQKMINETELLGGQHDWNWKNDYKNIINNILDKYPDIKTEYESNLKKIVEMSKTANMTESQIRLAATDMANNLKSKLPSKEEINKIIAETESIGENLKNINNNFNQEEFNKSVKNLIDNFKESNNSGLSKEDKDLVLSYAVAANERINKFLNRIKDSAIRDRIINRMKTLANSSLESSSPNYDSIMESMNQKIKNIEEGQLVHFEDSSINLETPEGLKPKQQFTYTIEDIMTDKRADVDFFEFVTIKREDLLGGEEEQYIDVTPDLITGVAPVKEGLYVYNVTLKYTNFTDGGKQKAIDTRFRLWVGVKPSKYTADDKMNTVLIIVIAILGTVFLSMLVIQIYNQCYKSKTFKFVEIDNASQYIDSTRRRDFGTVVRKTES